MTFIPGRSGNPNGRPKNPAANELRKAIIKVQKGEDCTLLEHFVIRAYKNDSVLIAVVKKLLPDLKTVETNIFEDGTDKPMRVVYVIEKPEPKKKNTGAK